MKKLKKKIELSDLMWEALRVLYENSPFPVELDYRTGNALVRRKLAVTCAHYVCPAIAGKYEITTAGRDLYAKEKAKDE